MRWASIFILLMTRVGICFSQGLEITERSDAIRPTLLAYKISDSSIVKLKYFVAQCNVGYASDYQYRDVFTKENLLIGRAAVNYYFNRMQLNGKVIGLHDPYTGQNYYRTKLQLGYSEPDSGDIVRIQLSWNTENRRSRIDPSVSWIHEFVADLENTAFLIDNGAGGPDVYSGYVVSYRPQLGALFYGNNIGFKVLEGTQFARSLYVGAEYCRDNIKGNDRSAVFKTQASLGLQGFHYRMPLYLTASYSVDYRDHYRKNWELGIVMGGDFLRSVTKRVVTPGDRGTVH